jgi:hypothetical protein
MEAVKVRMAIEALEPEELKNVLLLAWWKKTPFPKWKSILSATQTFFPR